MDKYFCQMCESIFSSEEELVNHIVKNHVQTFKDKSTDLEYLYERIRLAFPKAKVRVKDGKGWYAQYIIEVQHGETVIPQHFGNTPEKTYFQEKNPNTIEEAIDDIKIKMAVIDDILTEINALGEFDELICTGFIYGYSEDEHGFRFKYKLKGDEQYKFESYYPWDTNSTLKDFVNQFKGYFVNSLVGTWEQEYTDGYFTGYKIDGMNIERLLDRAKCVRLEIIERR